MTEKLFYQDSHRKEFQAKVLACENNGEQYRVVLDQTAFFPRRWWSVRGYGISGRCRSNGRS